jgi:GNAT superfamily N-acetyltransferase
VETGWAQVSPLLRETASREATAALVQQMLHMALSSPGSAALVARDGGVPVGYIIVAAVPDELTGMAVGLFVDIYVEPQWRGRGVSSKLTAAGDEHCRSLGLKAVRRHIAAHNEASLGHARADGCEIERIALIKRL